MAEVEKVILEKVDTLWNLVDALAKLMSKGKFDWCYESMGLMSLSNYLASLIHSPLYSCIVYDKWENVEISVSYTLK